MRQDFPGHFCLHSPKSKALKTAKDFLIHCINSQGIYILSVTLLWTFKTNSEVAMLPATSVQKEVVLLRPYRFFTCLVLRTSALLPQQCSTAYHKLFFLKAVISIAAIDHKAPVLLVPQRKEAQHRYKWEFLTDRHFKYPVQACLNFNMKFPGLCKQAEICVLSLAGLRLWLGEHALCSLPMSKS